MKLLLPLALCIPLSTPGMLAILVIDRAWRDLLELVNTYTDHVIY